jgi:hypothetical protein
VVLHPAGLESCILTVIREDQQPLPLSAVDHTLCKYVNVGNGAGLYRSGRFAVPPQLHTADGAAADTRDQFALLFLLLPRSEQLHQCTLLPAPIALLDAGGVYRSAVPAEKQRNRIPGQGPKLRLRWRRSIVVVIVIGGIHHQAIQKDDPIPA